MSSPPNPGPSPIMSSLNLPMKRPSLAPQPSAKRRKPSSGPSQLRQTSFPPEGADKFARSPSVESQLTTFTNKSKKRGKGKQADDARSTTGKSVAGATAAGSQAGKQDDEEVDEDFGEDENVLDDGGIIDSEVNEENWSILFDRLPDFEKSRYGLFKSSKLNKAAVRRLVNQTLSQSVPPNVINAVNGYTKIFLGEIIERARTVQLEWMAVSPKLPDGSPIPEDDGLAERTKLIDRGPLTPGHIREALRRYKKDRDSGGVGMVGLSLDGRSNAAWRVGGKRLFR